MTRAERNRLLEEALPQIRRSIRAATRRVPAHLRDEAQDELLVRAVRRGDRSNAINAHGFASFIAKGLPWLLIDWMREQHHWDHHDTSAIRSHGDIPALYGQEASEDSYGDSGLQSPYASPQRAAEVKAAILLLARLSDRERIALTSPDWQTAAELLGVTEARVNQLRRCAARRLADLGAAELLGIT
jgi:hypothetical protein